MRVSRRLGLMVAVASLPQLAMAGDYYRNGQLNAQAKAIVDDFVAMCMNGEARFARGEIKNVRRDELPDKFISSFGYSREGQYYRLSKYPDVFAIISDKTNAKHDELKKICAVGAEHVPASAAFERILRVIGLKTDAKVAYKTDSGLEYDDPTFTYILRVTVRRNTDDWGNATRTTIMQSSFLNDSDRAVRLENQQGKTLTSMDGNRN